MMYSIFNHLHSTLRYIVLLGLIVSIIMALVNKEKTFTKLKPWALITLIVSHLQLLIGFVLYGISPMVNWQEASLTMKTPVLRFYSVEHISMMIIAIVFITIGYSKSKKENTSKKILVFYSIALVLIFFAIPWPFLKDFGSWF